MIEKGKVIQIDDDRIVIEIDPKGACARCGINHCCSSTGSSKRQLSLKHSRNSLKPGDWVEIKTPAKSLLSAALLVFVLPLVISTIVHITVMNLSHHFGMALLAFFASFFLSIGLIAIIDRTIGKSRFFEPVIVKKNNKRINSLEKDRLRWYFLECL